MHHLRNWLIQKLLYKNTCIFIMLNQLNIRDFAIVESLELDLNNGMTVVSGETGAGKSIMLDALGLTLGDRAESGAVRHGAEKADISASFALDTIPEANNWLIDNDLDNDGECILRRVITKEGRSRCYINGRPSPAAMVKELGQHLIAIHGQHEHQRLLKKDYHRTLLDEFAGQSKLADEVKQQYQHWHKLDTELKRLSERFPIFDCSVPNYPPIRIPFWAPILFLTGALFQQMKI